MRTATLVLVSTLLCTACARNETPAAATATAGTPGAPAASSAAPTAEPATAPGELAVGKPAPDFTSTAHDGAELKISSLKGKHVVVYFYPKDETPGCTKEACAFRDAWKDLEARGVVLIGISTDSIESHKKFAEHHKLPFHLVSDADGSIASAYGVPNKGGFLARQSFVIGPDGNVKRIYRSVDVTKHASEILGDVGS